LFVVIALAGVSLSGCAGSPKADFYTLSEEAPRVSQPSVSPVAVLVGSVTVPDIVDRPQIVVRAGDNQVSLNEFARWADSLKNQIPRVVRADLSRLLNSPRVFAYPMRSDMAAAYRAQMDVQSFDPTLNEATTVDVLWSVVAPGGKGSPFSGRSTVREPCTGPGCDALVAAWSRAFATVSRDIAAGSRPAP
jgi:uncharacterized lipoprotein YmbA